MPSESSTPEGQPPSLSQLPTASQPSARSDPRAVHARPSHIGPYVVRRLIASGGMGDVYECHDPALDASVAVKVAHIDLASRPEIIEQIRSEARRLASVKRKDFVCRVLSAGETSIGGVTVPYVAMEFEPNAETLGGPLSNAWPLHQKVECFLHICDAVQSLHEQHLVHADIKPSNVLIVEGLPKLIDFGIARVVRRLGGERGQWVAGTPGYLDPAMLADPAATPDQRSDVYALGMTLAEFLSGRAPEIAPGHESGTPPTWPSRDRPPSIANRSIDPELDAIILRAIDPDPHTRFQSASELRDRLTQWLAYRRTLISRLGDHVRAVVSSGSMFLNRSRAACLVLIAIAAAAIAFACAWPVFEFTPLGGWAQSLAARGRAPSSLNDVRVIDSSDLSTFARACERHGRPIPTSPGGNRIALAALADRLAEIGELRAVGFDIIFLDARPEHDPVLLAALKRVAAACRSRTVAIGRHGWNVPISPGVQSPDDIRVASVLVNPPRKSDPPFMHMALLRERESLAEPSFATLVACAAIHPAGEPRVTVSTLWNSMSISFPERSPSGAWVERSQDRIELRGVPVQLAEDVAQGDVTPESTVAFLPIYVPGDAALTACTRPVADVMDMTPEDLRLWIGNRVVIVQGFEEEKAHVGGRTFDRVYYHATIVQALLLGEIVTGPPLGASAALTLAGAVVGVAFGFTAWQLSRTRSHTTAVSLGIAASLLACVCICLGCAWLGVVHWLFVNPAILCLAAILAVAVVMAFGRGTRTLAGELA